jgi:hypothetical protein
MESFEVKNRGRSATALLVEGAIACSISVLLANAAVAQVAAGITVGEIGHWHVNDTKQLTISVMEADANSEVEPWVEISQVGSDRVRVYGKDRLTADGDGNYALAYTPSAIGGYALVAKAMVGEELVSSNPVAFEVARAGDEGIKVTVDGTDYVYQIRYNWDPGHIHASHDHAVSLVFELMRGIPTGNAINWDRPWTNGFDHVVGAQDAKAILQSEDGTVTDNIDLAYQGRGIYRGERVFEPSEVGEERIYEVVLRFTDPTNSADVASPGGYGLRAVAGH